jgi:hypothetical protein
MTRWIVQVEGMGAIRNIQGVLGGKVNILAGYRIGNSKKKFYMNMCPIPNGFRDRAI